MLVLTSRYREETALRALRYFASFAFNVSLFLERIPFAQSSQRTAKLAASGWFLRRAAPTSSFEFKDRAHFADLLATAILNGRVMKRFQLRELCFIENAKLS
jgi:hypothetical protein